MTTQRNRNALRRVLSLEKVEERCCLSVVAFIKHDGVFGDASESVFADIDGDGDLDIISASAPFGDIVRADKIVWLENTGELSFLSPRSIAEDLTFPSIQVGDIDNDGDIDVLSSDAGIPGGNNVIWYENSDGKGTFETKHPVSARNERHVQRAMLTDLDGDSDLDVVAAWSGREQLVWHENDGGGTFGDERPIFDSRRTLNLRTMQAADVDEDGDQDVVATWNAPLSIGFELYVNSDGMGSFDPPQRIDRGIADSIRLVDMDGDDDIDILVAAQGNVKWYENSNGRGNFDLSWEVATYPSRDTASLFAADMDNDNDLDIVVVSMSIGVSWYENIDHGTEFGFAQQISNWFGYFGDVVAADLDKDRDMDLIVSSVGGGVTIYENRLLGDSNNDGVFDSDDFVHTFISGKYNDGIDNNATFNEGDWNQDGDFNEQDIVAAFIEGHYVTAAEPASSSLAAAIDAALADNDAKHAFVA